MHLLYVELQIIFCFETKETKIIHGFLFPFKGIHESSISRLHTQVRREKVLKTFLVLDGLPRGETIYGSFAIF